MASSHFLILQEKNENRLNGIFWQGLFLNTRLDGMGEVVERALGTGGLWSSGPWRQRGELLLQVGGKEASQGGLCVWWAHRVSSRMQAYAPSKAFCWEQFTTIQQSDWGNCAERRRQIISKAEIVTVWIHCKVDTQSPHTQCHPHQKKVWAYWEGGNP